MAFVFLLISTIAHFMQPGALEPELAEVPIYQTLIIITALLSLNGLISQWSVQKLTAWPTNLLVLCLLAFVVISNLAQANLYDARTGGAEFAKVALFYFLVVAQVKTPGRMRTFWLIFVTCAAVLAVLALLQFYGLIYIRANRMMEKAEIVGGEASLVVRVRSIGVFGDPNDFCLLLVVATLMCLYWLGERKQSAFRFLWAVPILLFGWAMVLTQSRGGFLSLVAGLGCLFYERYGRTKTLFLGAPMLLGLLVVFGGRMTDFGRSFQENETGDQRFKLWRDGLQAFKEHPVFGVGHGQYPDVVGGGLVAHNSYVHTFTELGFFGGAVFTGIMLLTFWSLHRLQRQAKRIPDPELLRLRPFLAAMIFAYAAGLFALSRPYVLPTYIVFAMGTAYLQMTDRYPVKGVLPPVNFRFFVRLAVLEVAMVAGIAALVRLAV